VHTQSIGCNNGKGVCKCATGSRAPQCSCNGLIDNVYTGESVQCTDMSPQEAKDFESQQYRPVKQCKQVGMCILFP
jgi:hypothetical protein